MATDARGNTIMSYGYVGGDVSWLKQVMGWWGYYDASHPDAALGADIYGWDIGNAIAKFQADYGISNSGVTDAATWQAIQMAAEGYPADYIRQQVSGGAAAPTLPGPGVGTQPGIPTQPSQNPYTRDAMARLQQILNQFGLSGMSEWVKSKLIAGSSEAEIQIELYDQPDFKARFPVIEARRAAGLTPVSPAEVLEYEQRGRELLRQAGITSNEFTSKEYLQGIMAKDVSLAEVQSRLNDGLLRVKQAPPEVRTMFGQYFGVSGDVAMAQFFLDPEKGAPELEKMATTAVVGGVGNRFKVDLTAQLAREIADTGVSDAGVWQQFQKLDSISSLFQESISETTDLTKEGTGVQAVFGTQAGASNALQRRADSRVAAFSGGGGAIASEAGVTGFGTADS